MKWSDVDFIGRIVIIRAPKNGVDQVIPLGDQAVALLQSRFRNRNAEHALVLPSSNGVALIKHWGRARKLYWKMTGTKDWACHDLRRTGSVLLGGLGVSQAVNNEALNHKPSRLEVTYNPAYKAGTRSDVAKALQKLADHIDSLMVDDMMVSLDKVA